jgi:hypothetical protein
MELHITVPNEKAQWRRAKSAKLHPKRDPAVHWNASVRLTWA